MGEHKTLLPDANKQNVNAIKTSSRKQSKQCRLSSLLNGNFHKFSSISFSSFHL